MTAGEEEQAALLPAPERVKEVARKATPPRERKPVPRAEVDPVARVLVDVALAHLDRPFDYVVPETMSADAQPGVRVKVRFAGQDVDGFIVERAVHDRAHRPAPAAAPGGQRRARPDPRRRCADRRGGAALRRHPVRRAPARRTSSACHRREAAAAPPTCSVPGRARPELAEHYLAATPFLDGLARGESPRAVWTVVPGDDWAELVTEAVVATAVSGRGALVCVPDHRDVARLDAALTARLGTDQHVVLAADSGPAKRYRAFLAVSRGSVRIVIGTRAAAFAPVQDLGLVAIWDDGDDLHDEPRAPYPHAREVLLLRAQETGSAALLAAHARSVEAEYLVRTHWATEVVAPREVVRRRIAVSLTGDSDHDLARDPGARSARLPSEAIVLLRQAVKDGPVLVQTPRAGYATRLACDRCRAPAVCDTCHGPLRLRGPSRPPECAWCATAAPGWQCAECGGHGLRAPVIGDARTAEELGRAVPGIQVRTSSSGDRVLETVDGSPAIVVATPGAEPVASGGYAAVLLMDTWLLLARSDLRATEEAVRRWANAAALVRAASDGGRVLAVGDAGERGLQALVRWDHSGLARREIEERQSAHLPPASRVATISGQPADLEQAVAALILPEGAEILGPVPRRGGARRPGRDRALRGARAATLRSRALRGSRGPPGAALHPQASAAAGRGGPGGARLRSVRR